MEVSVILVLVGLYLTIGVFWYDLIRRYFRAQHDFGVLATSMALWPMILVGVCMLCMIHVFDKWIEKRKEKKE